METKEEDGEETRENGVNRSDDDGSDALPSLLCPAPIADPSGRFWSPPAASAKAKKRQELV
jgi:hypothetical protein